MTTLNRPGAPDGHVCGIDAAMEIIGGKWKVLILWALDDRPARRFGELRRLLPGITEKVLASHLREMEADGIVRRVSYEEVPPRVEYSLTASGTRLNAALVPLAEWGRERAAAARAAGAEAPVGESLGGRGIDGQASDAVPAPGAQRPGPLTGRSPAPGTAAVRVPLPAPARGGDRQAR
ncbi:helix-turn-helix domain-containing protein [Streptomyces sp. CNQ-509]|uniref:winged helix-turn-helix transcriptional regulator n=1 Tax=Streptomyces sp. CNQ-509 TaxID=444103 RepID=UPI00099D1C7C|nr:helix-turn-helix domain-containing protein [Streptomyces sp. CNQ-509]